MMKKTFMLSAMAVAFCVAGVGVWWSSGHRSSPNPARKIVAYQDSMHPWVKSDHPGKCTICSMELTPLYEGDRGFAASDEVVQLSPNSITVLNVQTEEVRRKPLRLSFRVSGTLDADETRKAIFSAPAAGRIHEMVVGAVGDEVEASKPLLTFYSPDLSTWRRAYVVRSRTSSTATPLFAGRAHEDAANNNARTKAGVKSTNETHGAPTPSPSEPDPYFSDLLSPLSGTIIERKVFNGQYVTEGDRLLTIVDTSVLWFRFDVYERQLAWLRKGQKVLLSVGGLPGREFSGVISVIEPTLDEATRTVKVRANIANPVVGDAAQKQRLLRLGMYAEASVQADVPDVLTVQRTAILSPGGQTYAYVEAGAGAYAMRRVKLGRQGDGRYEVIEGLKEGDRVVTAGNVLIDAQAQFTQPRREESAQVEGNLSQPSTSDTRPHSVVEMAEPEFPPKEAQTVPLSGPVSFPSISAAQKKALDEFLNVTSDISTALASDSLVDLQRALPRLKAMTAQLQGHFGMNDPLCGKNHPWWATVQRVAAASAWPEVKDLAAARATFLPFSTQAVKLVQLLQASESQFRSMQVYHCPTAPKPGLWAQGKGPLRNPYFGAKMLNCGEEVHETAQAAAAVPPVPISPPAPAPVIDAPPPASTIRTMNTRHPEAKEQMLRSFALGVAERHRMASNAPAGKIPATGKSAGEPTVKQSKP